MHGDGEHPERQQRQAGEPKKILRGEFANVAFHGANPDSTTDEHRYTRMGLTKLGVIHRGRRTFGFVSLSVFISVHPWLSCFRIESR
jgi:hypothetical protein